ncbi:MAG TPA: cation:proton antiporter, partial [Labilithrix sp.]|nr:cation:proton antiporter [Labilithrix sp.]
VAFLVGMVVVGLLVVPKVMGYVVRIGRPETTVVASIGLCFGFAHACAAMHYSVALGAFVAGMLISESGEGHTVEHHIVPVRDMFAAIFFVSVGMLIDPALVIDNWVAVLVLSVVVIVGKIVGVTLGGVVTGCGLRTSVQSGLSLSQIGEFSFIIVSLGLSLNATRPFLFPVAVAVSAITTLTTPTLIRRSERAAKFVEDRCPRRITSFVALYSAWLERVRSAPASSTTGARLRRLGTLLVLDAVFIVGLLIGGAVLHERAASAAAARFGLSGAASEALFMLGAALIGLPFVFGIVRVSRAIGLTVAGVGKKAARPIAVVVELGLLTAVAAASVTALESFVPPGIGLFLLVALVAVAVFAFWRNAGEFEVEVRAGGAAVMDVLKKLSANAEAHASDGTGAAPFSGVEASELLRGLGAPSLFRVERGSVALGAALGELDLRAKTGAAVLAIVRDGSVLMMPDPKEPLREGDVLAIVGSDEALSKAAPILASAKEVDVAATA